MDKVFAAAVIDRILEVLHACHYCTTTGKYRCLKSFFGEELRERDLF